MIVLLLWLFPLAFACAVVRHRVLEIPVLLRRSARYLLVQRGSAGLLVFIGIAATIFFASTFSRYLGPGSETAAIALGSGFGSVLVCGHNPALLLREDGWFERWCRRLRVLGILDDQWVLHDR